MHFKKSYYKKYIIVKHLKIKTGYNKADGANYLLISFSSIAQKKVIEIETINQDNTIQLYGVNNTNFTHEVTLILPVHKGLKGYTKPVTKKIKPNSKLLFVTLSYKGAYSYNMSLSFKLTMTEQEKKMIAKKKKGHILKDFSKIKEGIVIFDKIECPRCNRAIAFLIDNNIAFKSVDINEKEDNNKKMWETLKANGVNGKIATPVFLVNGKLSHSHKNLGAFLESLKE